MKELVSIILPVYNGEQFIKQAIDSCLNQTYTNFELIIVNDCSTDNTLEISNDFAEQDQRIKIINNSTNKKLPATLNIGHEVAQGEFLTWISDDNLYLPDAIERMVSTIQQQDVDFVYADFIQINGKGEQLRVFKLEEPEELLWRNIVGACFLYLKKVFEGNKGYSPDLFMVEDYDFWLRTFLQFKCFHIKEILYLYRIHKDSLTSQSQDNQSDRSITLQKNKIEMFDSIFKTHSFPKILQELILKFQQNYKVNHKQIEENLRLLKAFYKSLSYGRYTWHLYYLKEKYIKGIRQDSKNQGFIAFWRLLFNFGTIMTNNDYKTSLKILTHSIFKK